MKMYFEKFSAAAYEMLLILVNFIPYRIFLKYFPETLNSFELRKINV